MRAALERACARAGFRPRVTFEAAAPHVLAQLAARGLGVAVLPAGEDGPPPGGATGTPPAPQALRTLTIVRPGIRARIALAWQTGGPASPAARALLGALDQALPKPSDGGSGEAGQPVRPPA